MRRVPQKPVLSTEYLFRTVEACFEHRVPLKTRRVPEEAFLSTARIFGTVGGRFRYRVPSKGQGKGPPETSSALAGRRKWWKGPERTKRAGAVSRTEDVSGGQVLLLARHASENASGSAGGCPQSVESTVLRAFEDAFGVTGCRLAHL